MTSNLILAEHLTGVAKEDAVLMQNIKFCLICSILISKCSVCVEALHPSQQFFSHVRTVSSLGGLNQYKEVDKCVLIKDTTQ